MNDLRIGYGCSVINGECGMGIEGYFVPRYVKGRLDDLTAQAIYISLGGEAAIILSLDVIGIRKELTDKISAKIEAELGVCKDSIFVSATHTHTAPIISDSEMFPIDEEGMIKYRDVVCSGAVAAAKAAIADAVSSKIAYGTAMAPDRIAYIRRYRMRDGSTMTCPPINDPDIMHPLGTLDQRVNVVRFDREGKESVIILNYGLHADTIGGELSSSDWCGWVRRTLDKALDGAKCLCIMGAQGDVGSTNVHPTASDMNDTDISFDNEMKSPGMARFVGRALAGAVLSVYDKLTYFEPSELKVAKKTLTVPSNMPTPEDMPRAREYKRLHEAGRDDLIPYSAMELTTVVAEALRMCELENGPESYDIELIGLSLGKVALVGIPGEPFTDIGVRIKESDTFPLVMPTALSNGYMGYFPDSAAFAEGGYESRSSKYRAGVAEAIIDTAKTLLEEIS